MFTAFFAVLIYATTPSTLTTQGPVPVIAWKDLEQGPLIGNGSFGDVYRGKWKGQEVAIKALQMKTLAPHLAQDFNSEAQLMWQCQFPNVLRLHGVCLEPGHSAMVLELMRGSLYQWLHSGEQISMNLRWQVALDIAKGIADLHARSILHRDLKSFNVLLDSQYHAKISDFGLARLKLESRSTSTARTSSHAVGTVRWRAPELFKRNAQATAANDIYSYGIVLWELLTGKIPFSDAQDEVTVMGWVKDGEKETIPPDCPPIWKEIIEACWQAPEKRPTAAEIVKALEAGVPKVAMTKSWHFESALKPTANEVQDYVLLPAEGEDFKKVLGFYQQRPVPGYDIGTVRVIYNPSQNMIFSRKLPLLQSRANNPAFKPKWAQDDNPALRAQVDKQWQTLAAPYTDQDCPDVKLLPLWHGTRPEILESIFKTGYANLAVTDSGYFGKGIYGAYEAEYAFRVYSKGALVLNWVAAYSAYPVIDGDMSKLEGRGNYANYDAHFIPVRPQNPSNPNEEIYLPCGTGQKATYTEVVVFDSGQCLPRYVVELQPSLPKAIDSAKPQPPVNNNVKSVPPQVPAVQQALPPQTTSAKQEVVPVNSGIPIPLIAKGYEEIYKRFYNGRLIYKKGQPDEVVLPFSGLSNPLEGTFDLSRCGDAGRYLSIATGYKQSKNPANASKVEVWIAPKFLIERNYATQMSGVVIQWTSTSAPIGLFWTWGGSEASAGCDYLTTETVDNISANNIYENWRHSRRGETDYFVTVRVQAEMLVPHISFVN